jgi:hypothetical protein
MAGMLRAAGVFALTAVLSGIAGAQEKNPVTTFLDTLNKGKEVSLTEADFSHPPFLPAVPKAVGTDTVPAIVPAAAVTRHEEAGVVPSRFKIQVLAGPNEQQVKKEKTTLAAKAVGLPLSISFEAPYYKLLAGDFAQHSEAETWCSRLKDMGYGDAWIVRTAAVQKPR